MGSSTVLLDQIEKLKEELAEALKNEHSSATAYAELKICLAEAQEQLDSAKYQSRLMSAAEHRRLLAETQSQAAQLAGMREALKELSIGVFTDSREPLTNKDVHKLATTALSIPASEWEKRVQGLVEALRLIAKEALMASDTEPPFMYRQEIAAKALAAWKDK